MSVERIGFDSPGGVRRVMDVWKFEIAFPLQGDGVIQIRIRESMTSGDFQRFKELIELLGPSIVAAPRDDQQAAKPQNYEDYPS